MALCATKREEDRWGEVFFPRSNPFSSEGTSLQPHSQCVLPFQNGGQTRKIMISYILNSKITVRYKKVASTAFFFISLSLYSTSIPHKYSIFIQNLKFISFQKDFAQKTVRFGALLWNREKWQKIVRLTAEPWELAGLTYGYPCLLKTLSAANSKLACRTGVIFGIF